MSEANATNKSNTIQFNGQDYKILPLNWNQLKERREDIIVINGLNPASGMFSEVEQEAILRVVTASVQRTRDDVNEEFVAKHLDLGNVGPILRMVFGQSKGDASSGEAKAATSQT